MAIDLLFHMNERVHQKTLKIHYFNSLQYFKRSRSGAVTSQSTFLFVPARVNKEALGYLYL